MSQYHVKSHNIEGEIIHDNDTYTVRDNKSLKNLCLSSTDLRPNKSTNGHAHAGQEEVYMFLDGDGWMELDSKEFQVMKGDTVLIPDGAFHRVRAGDRGCYFVCVFDGQRYDHVAVLGYD